MKSLHLCNVANVAYGYCKILNQFNEPAELRCHDLLHVMSQPEWDDLELDSRDFPEENDFTINKADFGNYRRPSWFQAIPVCPKAATIPELADKLLPVALNGGSTKLAIRRAESFKRRMMHAAKSSIPIGWKEHLRNPYHRVLGLTLRMLGLTPIPPIFQSPRVNAAVFKRRVRQLVEISKKFDAEWHLTPEMLGAYRPHAHWLDRHLTDHDVTFAYVYTPIYAMLQGMTPYIAVEIGTMRDLPFDGTPMGKMLAMGYRLADHIVITNPDVVAQAKRLGLERYTFCPHPVDEDIFRPIAGEFPIRRELLAKHQAEFILIAPARQNWAVKGNDRLLQAFAQVLKKGVKAVLLIPGWGQEIGRSQELCKSLGIGSRVAWTAPVSEPVLTKYFQAADIVLDQFILGVFGLVTCKALACGKPVLTSYDKPTHAWCFAEHPPVVNCSTAEEIYQAIMGFVQSPAKMAEYGAAARKWVLEHHSKRVVLGILQEIMKRAVSRARQTKGERLDSAA